MIPLQGDQSIPVTFDLSKFMGSDHDPGVIADAVATLIRCGLSWDNRDWRGLQFRGSGLIYRVNQGKLIRAYRVQLRDDVYRMIQRYVEFIARVRRRPPIAIRTILLNEVMRRLGGLFPSTPTPARPVVEMPPLLTHQGLPLLLGKLSAGDWWPVHGDPHREYLSGIIAVRCTSCRRSIRSKHPRLHFHGWGLESTFKTREHRGSHCESPRHSGGYYIALDENEKHDLTPGEMIYRQTPKCRISRAIELESKRQSQAGQGELSGRPAT